MDYLLNLKKQLFDMNFVAPLVVSSVIFAYIVAFGSYASAIELDYVLLSVIGVGAYIGGMIGNHILHYKVSAEAIKKILAFALYIIAIKMLWL